MGKIKVLITGGAGFIGSHLVEHLLKNTDWEIVILDRLDTSGNLNRLADIMIWEKEKGRVKFFWHDLKAPVNELLAKQIGGLDYIFHLAATTHVDRSIDDPLLAAMDNVIGTVNILNFARNCNREEGLYPKVLYFSTDEVFGPAPEGVEHKEWDRYKSGNPYAASKAGGEEMALAFHNTYGLPVIITHTMNVFGERQHPEKFIPKTIRQVLEGKVVKLHADSKRTKPASRFWIHARNVAAAILFLSEKGEPGEKYNIVGEREVNVLEMAETIAKILETPLLYELVDFHSSRPGHDLRYALDGAKMRELGWKLPVGFDESLRKTVNWLLSRPEWL